VIVSRILHAGYIFESGGTRIAFDPILETPFSTNCYPFPAVSFAPEATRAASRAPTVHDYDAVFISHFHDDHCSLVSLDFIPRTVPIYLYCVHGELFDFIRAMGFNVRSLQVDAAVEIGAFRITPRLALDPDVDTVFEICAEGLAVLNVVDAWIDPSVLSLRSSWDLVLWPFQTMCELDVLMPARAEPASRSLPPEWVEQLRALRPRHVVPSSCQIRFEEWSWMNRTYFPITYAQFAREIPASVRMNPGESFALTAQSFSRIGRLAWVSPEGPQDVDYEYDSSSMTTSTSEIARRFPALTSEQRAFVDRFCEGLDVTLYDHEGRPAGSGSTEAIAYKIFRALTEGEQITSMYLRTDDIDADELIAKLSQDPLAFQRAQLKRLSLADSNYVARIAPK
jgi:hypothetical protein